MEIKEGNVQEMVAVCDALMDCDPVSDPRGLKALTLSTNGRTTAFALYRKTGSVTQVDRLFVHRVFRGKGNGKMLLKALMEQEGGDFCLQVWVHNLKARKLYESLGFRETARFGDFIDMYTGVQLWCYCQKPDDHDVYVECSGSRCPHNNWVHEKCGGDSLKEFYMCTHCQAEYTRAQKPQK